jgi:tetratricopeptide (TPR) repeat protein
VYPVLLVGFIGYCAIMSWLAIRRAGPLTTVPGTLAGVAVFVSLMGATMAAALRESAAPAEALIKGAILILPSALFAPFVIRCIDVWQEATRRSALSLDRIKPVRTYDLAEKSLHEGDLEEAIRLYREIYMERDPADPIPHLRVAELQLKRGRRDEARESFMAAAERFEDPQSRVISALRAAELMSDPGPYLRSIESGITDPRLRAALGARLKTTRA